MNFQAVTFDLWNTLFVSPPGGIEVRRGSWQKVIDDRDLEISSELLLSVLEMLPIRFDSEWKSGRQYRAKEALDDAFEIFGEKIDLEDKEEFSKAFDAASLELVVEVVDGSLEVLKYLNEIGVKTGIVSDTSLSAGRHLREYLKKFGLLPYINSFAFSDEVGVYKPDTKIFWAALEGIKIYDPTKAAHVGDLKRTDVAGAQKMNMTSVRFRGVVDDTEDGPEAELIIDNLLELPSVLGI
mgnify:CR=1 FL=1